MNSGHYKKNRNELLSSCVHFIHSTALNISLFTEIIERLSKSESTITSLCLLTCPMGSGIRFHAQTRIHGHI